jgi:putative SOS response-associated peptidase YedK
MLTPNSAKAWLNGDANVHQLERPNVVFHPVGKAVGNTRNNSAQLIEPIDV